MMLSDRNGTDRKARSQVWRVWPIGLQTWAVRACLVSLSIAERRPVSSSDGIVFTISRNDIASGDHRMARIA
jgi:hypothetical protein